MWLWLEKLLHAAGVCQIGATLYKYKIPAGVEAATRITSPSLLARALRFEVQDDIGSFRLDDSIP